MKRRYREGVLSSRDDVLTLSCMTLIQETHLTTGASDVDATTASPAPPTAASRRPYCGRGACQEVHGSRGWANHDCDAPDDFWRAPRRCAEQVSWLLQ